jgi:hypothetical protein
MHLFYHVQNVTVCEWSHCVYVTVRICTFYALLCDTYHMFISLHMYILVNMYVPWVSICLCAIV